MNVQDGCPNCGADCPDLYSPVGSLEGFCDACGWASDEELPITK